MSLHCLLIAASHRPDSLNRKLAALAAAEFRKEGFGAELPDYGAFDLPIFNDTHRQQGKAPEALNSVAALMSKAEALAIASPEYNWSYPGSLKNTLDWVSHLAPNPLSGKPALLMSATPSQRGGVVGLAHLKTVLESLGMYVMPSSFLLARANEAFAEDGTLAEDGQKARLSSLIHDFSAYAKALHRL